MQVPFNKPYIVGGEQAAMQRVFTRGKFCGSGPETSQCHTALSRLVGSHRALLTNSCTAALEMSAILADIGPGDEVIMPSFTFVSTANAVVLRGGVPVFVDIRPDTFNIDESLIEEAITDKTCAIMVVHYAGVACEVDAILAVARKHNLAVIEDAAQCMFAYYKDRHLGSFGDAAAFSFHETKNIQSGEGGALTVNNPSLAERAEIIWEKGTNRSQFLRGNVDKYTWVDVGSSFLPGELTAAFLGVQLEHGEDITQRRLTVWNSYHEAFAGVESAGKLRRPIIPAHCRHNAHMYPVLLPDSATQDRFIEALKDRGVQSVFHYVPLHSAPAGRQFGRAHGDLQITDDTFSRLVRLPLWAGMNDEETGYVIDSVQHVLNTL